MRSGANLPIASGRRLFMTATPRFYTPRLRKEAGLLDVEVASMDDRSVFGPVLHRLTFGDAIERELLLVKVTAAPDRRAELVSLADVFGARVVDVGSAAMTFEIVEHPTKLIAFEDTDTPVRARGHAGYVRHVLDLVHQCWVERVGARRRLEVGSQVRVDHPQEADSAACAERE